MKKSPARSVQNNTLLNYFKPKEQSSDASPKPDTEATLTPSSKKSANTPTRSSTAKANSRQEQTPTKRKIKDSSNENYQDSDNESPLIKRRKYKRIVLNESSEDEYCPNQSSDNDDEEDEDSFIDEIKESSFEVEEEEELPKKKSNRKSSKNTPSVKENRKRGQNKKKKIDNLKDDPKKSNEELSQLNNLQGNLKANEIKMTDSVEIPFSYVSVDPSVYNSGQECNDQIDKVPLKYAVLENKKLITQVETSSNSSMNIEKATSAENCTNTQWPHLSYKFLQPENIKDLNGNKMLINGELNPDYDPSTLYVPRDFLDEQTPAIRQWWMIKSKHFDTILFYKMGKFYEFYHMDAVLCAQELKILFMRGEFAHSGFPEKSYKSFADALIQKGYKVARVEQTETPEMMKERCQGLKVSKFDKVVKREVCRISTLGTRFLSEIDSDTFLDCTSYLMALTCQKIKNGFEFGVSFVDVSLGKFFISQFKDDRFHSKLRTLVCHYCPVEIIIESGNKLSKLIEAICSSARIQPVKQFWKSNQTLKFIYEKEIWSNVSDEFKNSILDSSDVIQQTCRPEFELAITSFGAIIEHLEKCLIIDDIMSIGQFAIYNPPEYDSTMTKLPNHMILDSMTTKNLEIFESLNNNKSKTSTLFKIIDNCSTAFGKRTLRNWICQPICGLREDLQLRQEAVRELAENKNIAIQLKQWKDTMKKIPDLNRLLTQIHTQSLKRNKDHPDSRAIMFETEIYRKRRIKTFLDTIDGLEKINEIVRNFSKYQLPSIKSGYIKKLFSTQKDGGLFPKIEDKIEYFRNSFNADTVRQQGNFIPEKGVDEDYDRAIDEIDSVKKKLDDYLKQQEKYFKTRINFCDFQKNRYILEIPDSCKSKLSKSDEQFDILKGRKGFIRCSTPTSTKLVEELENAENQREIILGDIFRKFLAKFDQDNKTWCQAINCMAQFDALMSLANTRQVFESNDSCSCLPEFIWDQTEPMIRAKDLRNAFLVINQSVIPNDIELKGETLILTGPNMGGKTTFMRSVGLMTILAQIGAYVPARECQLTPVDRIFTRIGAYDLVLENESTFMVELNEALAIIKYASSCSLALIDELGSGTSTFDGTAIASAIIDDLTEKIKCRTLFSTHYHSILNELQEKTNIKLGFMSYMIENENDKDPTEENIIYLYKLTAGTCNKSFGFNVAKLAGISLEVIRRAYMYSKQFDLECQIKSLLNWFRVRKQNSKQSIIDDEVRKKARQLHSIMQDLKKSRENNL